MTGSFVAGLMTLPSTSWSSALELAASFTSERALGSSTREPPTPRVWSSSSGEPSRPPTHTTPSTHWEIALGGSPPHFLSSRCVYRSCAWAHGAFASFNSRPRQHASGMPRIVAWRGRARARRFPIDAIQRLQRRRPRRGPEPLLGPRRPVQPPDGLESGGSAGAQALRAALPP